MMNNAKITKKILDRTLDTIRMSAYTDKDLDNFKKLVYQSHAHKHINNKRLSAYLISITTLRALRTAQIAD